MDVIMCSCARTTKAKGGTTAKKKIAKQRAERDENIMPAYISGDASVDTKRRCCMLLFVGCSTVDDVMRLSNNIRRYILFFLLN